MEEDEVEEGARLTCPDAAARVTEEEEEEMEGLGCCEEKWGEETVFPTDR